MNPRIKNLEDIKKLLLAKKKISLILKEDMKKISEKMKDDINLEINASVVDAITDDVDFVKFLYYIDARIAPGEYDNVLLYDDKFMFELPYIERQHRHFKDKDAPLERFYLINKMREIEYRAV